MNQVRNLRLSARFLRRSPLRTALAISGMSLGIASVTLLMGLGEGAEHRMQATMERLGRNLLAINTARVEANPLRGGAGIFETLVLSDATAIQQTVDHVALTAPITTRNRLLQAGDRALGSPVLGATPDLAPVRNLELAAGRFIDREDLEERRRVAVLGARVVEELFYGEWPIGESILVGRMPFTVIGVVRPKGISPEGSDEDTQIIVPITTAHRRLFDVDFLDRIFVQVTEKKYMGHVVTGVRSLLRDRHQLTTERDDFEIRDQAKLLADQTDTGMRFRRMIMVLACLALAMGSLGLLANAVLSVSERTAEIGLRMALGARSIDILSQFLAESVMLALAGGLLGIILGLTGILVGERLTGWPMAVSIPALVAPFVLSLIIAVVFGCRPAWRASRFNPVMALESK